LAALDRVEQCSQTCSHEDAASREERLVERPGGVSLQLIRHMGVDVHAHSDLRVAEHLHDHARVDSKCAEDARLFLS